jgi:hypothetical protein
LTHHNVGVSSDPLPIARSIPKKLNDINLLLKPEFHVESLTGGVINFMSFQGTTKVWVFASVSGMFRNSARTSRLIASSGIKKMPDPKIVSGWAFCLLQTFYAKHQ